MRPWLMRILGAIVEPTTGLLAIGVADLFHRRGIRAKPVGDDAQRSAIFLHDALEKLQRRGLGDRTTGCRRGARRRALGSSGAFDRKAEHSASLQTSRRRCSRYRHRRRRERLVVLPFDVDPRAAVGRVTIRRTTLEIQFAEGMTGDAPDRVLVIPWTPPSPYRRREIIQGEGEQPAAVRPMRTKTRAVLIDALRDAHRWLNERQLRREPERSGRSLGIVVRAPPGGYSTPRAAMSRSAYSAVTSRDGFAAPAS